MSQSSPDEPDLKALSDAALTDEVESEEEEAARLGVPPIGEEGRDDEPTTTLKLGGFPVTTVAERIDFAKLLIYGSPGAGKTMLAGSAAEVEAMSPVLFIDIEGGTKTIRNLWPEVEVVRVQATYNSQGQLTATAWKKLQAVYEDLRKGVKWKTVVVDSLSEAAKVSMYSVMENAVRDAANKGQRDRDPDIPELRDWGKSGEQIRRFVRSFRDLPCHVIFTCLAADDKDQQSGTVTVKPALSGKLRDEIPAYLDEVLYLYVKADNKGVTRKILSEPTAKYVAKDRSGRLPTTVDDPTMAKLAEAILD